MMKYLKILYRLLIYLTSFTAFSGDIKKKKKKKLKKKKKKKKKLKKKKKKKKALKMTS